VRFYLEDATTPFAEVTPSGTPAPKQTTATTSFNLATVTTSSVHFRVETLDTAGQPQSAVIEVQRVHVIDLKADGQGTNNWSALASSVVALRSGTLTLDQEVTVGGLVILNGAKIVHTATPSATSPKSVQLRVNGATYVGCGGAIDVTGRGYPAGTTYPGHVNRTSASGGSHLGEGGPYAVVAETFGSVYFPQENGGGGEFYRGGGAIHIRAERVQVDGSILANGQPGNRLGAGGSVWIETASLGGTGTIEAKGGSSTDSYGSGGGGAISIFYATLDPASTLLDHLNAQGGATGITGGAGTIYLRGPSSTLGSVRIDNGTVTGNRRTIFPSLGRGIVQAGSSGGTVLTGRDATIPAYFVGHWLEVEGQDRFVKGVWAIAAVDGTTITLEPNPNRAFNIAAGDRWRGIYRFDTVTVASGSVLVSTDKIVQLVPPLPPEGLVAGAAKASKALDDGSETLYGNDTAPAWVKSAVAIAVGSVPGSYRIVLAPNAVADPDGISEVRLTSGGRSVSMTWSSTAGATVLWAGFPGQRLQLVAIDAHSRVRRAGWLELPPLPVSPDGSWTALLQLGAGVTPRAVAANDDWLGIGDEGVQLYAAGAVQAAVSLPPHERGEQVADLAAAGERFLVATDKRVEVLDLHTPAVYDLPVDAGRVLDLAAGTDDAIVLLADDRDPAHTALRLAELHTPADEGPTLSAASELAVPALAAPRLARTDGRVHLLGLDVEQEGVIYTWPASAAGEVLTAEPTVSELAGGWRGIGAWSQGAVLLAPAAVRLLAYEPSGWREVSRVDLDGEPIAAAVAGSHLVVLLAGEIAVYDVGDPAAPVLVASHPGSSYRAVEPLASGEVLLWSPPLAAPPLRWDPATALPGDGFTTVIDGLP